MRYVESHRPFEQNVITCYDVSDRVKSWGRRGILSGGLVGFTLGLAFVAVPHNAHVLTFGVIGTLIVGAVEGAVIAGAIGACAAALYSKGILRSRDLSPDRTRSSGWRGPAIGWQEGDIPLSDWPTRRRNPASSVEPTLLEANRQANTVECSWQEARKQLGTIDAWENGCTGP